jgi:hypothetical protein
MNGPLGEKEWRRQVVGHTFGAPIQQDWKIQPTRRIRQAAPNRLAGGNYVGDRTVAKIQRFEEPEAAFRDLHLRPRLPNKSPGDDLRMQGAYRYRRSPQRNAAAKEAIA